MDSSFYDNSSLNLDGKLLIHASVSLKYSHNYDLLDTVRQDNVSTLFIKIECFFICVVEYIFKQDLTRLSSKEHHIHVLWQQTRKPLAYREST